jgi:hypothetical protein
MSGTVAVVLTIARHCQGPIDQTEELHVALNEISPQILITSMSLFSKIFVLV